MKDIKNQRPNRIKNSIVNPYSISETTNIKPKFSSEFDDTQKNPTSILEYSNSNHGKLHPTQKPVALFEYLIRTYTNEGDTVLDNCAGSGTTGIACLKTGRKSIQIEKEEVYVEIAVKRLAQGVLSFES